MSSSSRPDGSDRRAAILGCAGTSLTAEERRFFAESRPAGFILFQRNCTGPEQIRDLTAALRDCVDDPTTPILIDQEGGRVQRLKPPIWRQAPPAATIAGLYGQNPEKAARAAWLTMRLIAHDLHALGIDVDCAPVLDNPVPGAHDVIGDRAWGHEVEQIARLGRAVSEGLMAGGVLPVIKHIPGHGRSMVDSHHDLPVVEASDAVLSASDLPPFHDLADQPFAMTAHIRYTAWDADNVATWSPVVIGNVIRKRLGFDNVLMSDDLSMKALGGDFASRSRRSIAAGCDVVLHCNGDMNEMRPVVEACGVMTDAAKRRWRRALAMRRTPEPAEPKALLAELNGLLGVGIA
ncbi:MAG TPA: beta-N-acetylhexosaminidase [Stellaceae bacterium]|nr:beta-N-acetylhexosaminidase [Stellaceae bacterium]